MTKNLVLIARVSTDAQEYSMAVQEAKCQQWCAERGYSLTVLQYRPVSGAAKKRPDIDEALALVKAGKAQGIIALRLDRIARSLTRLTTLAQELERMGADLVCVEQAVDTTTPAGRLVYHILGAVAEFERDLIRQRTREGLAEATRRGVHVGRAAGETLAAGRERVLELAEQGLSASAIVAQLNAGGEHAVGKPWHRTQVVRLLKSG